MDPYGASKGFAVVCSGCKGCDFFLDQAREREKKEELERERELKENPYEDGSIPLLFQMELRIKKVGLIVCKRDGEDDQDGLNEWLSMKADVTFTNGKKVRFGVNASFFKLECFGTPTELIGVEVDHYCDNLGICVNNLK